MKDEPTAIKPIKPTPGSTSRRNALRNLLVSGSVVSSSMILPKSWTQPVVDSVILPAHANTTAEASSQGEEVQTVNYFIDLGNSSDMAQLERSNSRPGNFAERVLDVIVPVAQASHRVNQFVSWWICIAITGQTYTARLTRYYNADGYAIFDYTGLAGTVGTELNLPDPTTFCESHSAAPASMLVDQVTPGSCRCTIAGSDTEVVASVPKAPCEQPNLSCPG